MKLLTPKVLEKRRGGHSTTTHHTAATRLNGDGPIGPRRILQVGCCRVLTVDRKREKKRLSSLILGRYWRLQGGRLLLVCPLYNNITLPRPTALQPDTEYLNNFTIFFVSHIQSTFVMNSFVRSYKTLTRNEHRGRESGQGTSSLINPQSINGRHRRVVRSLCSSSRFRHV